jgi:hypothetical protein
MAQAAPGQGETAEAGSGEHMGGSTRARDSCAARTGADECRRVQTSADECRRVQTGGIPFWY